MRGCERRLAWRRQLGARGCDGGNVKEVCLLGRGLQCDLDSVAWSVEGGIGQSDGCDEAFGAAVAAS